MPYQYIPLVEMPSSSSSPSARRHFPDYGTTAGPESKQSGVVQDDAEGAFSDTSSESEQAGVKAISAVSRIWTPWSLGVAYTG